MKPYGMRRKNLYDGFIKYIRFKTKSWKNLTVLNRKNGERGAKKSARQEGNKLIKTELEKTIDAYAARGNSSNITNECPICGPDCVCIIPGLI